MKRLCPFLLTICLLIFSTASAEEILFRGISWDTDVQTFWNIVQNELGQSIDPDSRSGQYLLENACLECNVFEYMSIESDGIYSKFGSLDHYPTYQFFVSCSGNAFVAGYPISHIGGFAIPSVKDGIVHFLTTDNRVINAYYSFDLDRISIPYSEVYSALHKKLSSLYGCEHSHITRDSYTSNIWVGTDDTYVELSYSFPEAGYGNTYLSLEYGVLDVPDLINFIEHPELTIDTSSIDGL